MNNSKNEGLASSESFSSTEITPEISRSASPVILKSISYNNNYDDNDDDDDKKNSSTTNNNNTKNKNFATSPTNADDDDDGEEGLTINNPSNVDSGRGLLLAKVTGLFNLFRSSEETDRLKLLFFYLLGTAPLLVAGFLFDHFVLHEKFEFPSSVSLFERTAFLTVLFGGYLVSEMLFSCLLVLVLRLLRSSFGSLLFRLQRYGALLAYLFWTSTMLVLDLMPKFRRDLVPEELQPMFSKSIRRIFIFCTMMLFKKHMVTSLAINFNVRCYVEAMKEAFRSENIIKNLRQARAHYKAMKRRPSTASSLLHLHHRPPSISSLFQRPSTSNLLCMTSADDLHNHHPPDVVGIASLPCDDASDGVQIVDKFMSLVYDDKSIYSLLSKNCSASINRHADYVSEHMFKWLKFTVHNKYSDPESASHTVPVIYRSELLPYFYKGDLDAVIKEITLSEDAKEITRGDLKSFLVRVYKERHRISRSLTCSNNSIRKVNRTCNYVLYFMLANLLIPVIFEIAYKDFKEIFSFFVLGFSFMFGNSAKNLFESVIFIFYRHPYDLGDRISLSSGSGGGGGSGNNLEQTLVVRDIELLTTEFTDSDGVRIYIPNSNLATMQICNYKRSGSISERLVLNFKAPTPVSQLHAIRDKLFAFLLAHPNDFTDTMCFELIAVEEQGALMKVKFQFQHRSNYQDMNGVNRRRNMVLTQIANIMKHGE